MEYRKKHRTFFLAILNLNYYYASTPYKKIIDNIPKIFNLPSKIFNFSHPGKLIVMVQPGPSLLAALALDPNTEPALKLAAAEVAAPGHQLGAQLRSVVDLAIVAQH